MEPELKPIKGGWAALAPTWAVHGKTQEEALANFRAAEQRHAEIMARPEREAEPAPDKLRAQHVLLVLLGALGIGYNAESLREPRITEARKGLQTALRVAYRAGQEQAREALIEWAHRQELALRMVIDDSDGEEETAGELRIVLHTWEQVSREARRLEVGGSGMSKNLSLHARRVVDNALTAQSDTRRQARAEELLHEVRDGALEEAARLYEDTMPAVAAEIRALKGAG